MTPALTCLVMPVDENTKRLTIELPADLHEAFQRKCFLAKPRVTMKERIIGFIAKETGLPMPEMIDKRKLTLPEREALEQKQQAAAAKPRK